MAKDIDHYAVLGVRPEAASEEIRKAYYAKAKICHPDRGGSHRQMRMVNQAWEVLGDAVARQQYDALRQRPVTTAPDTLKKRRQPEERTIISEIGEVVMKAAFWIGTGFGWVGKMIAGKKTGPAARKRSQRR
jgi:curved DNA-binding protein CbpA